MAILNNQITIYQAFTDWQNPVNCNTTRAGRMFQRPSESAIIFRHAAVFFAIMGKNRYNSYSQAAIPAAPPQDSIQPASIRHQV